jgi:hypothetical protein
MKGSLVTWIYDEGKEKNLCVIISEYLEKDVDNLIGEVDEDEPLYLVYDFITKSYFYALEEELSFV